MKALSSVTERYIKATQRGPAFAGDFAQALSDADAETVYTELAAIKFAKLVRPLWYDYTNQRIRPFARERAQGGAK